jgi:DNA-binding GntR family transcriptional regulator
MTFRAQDSLAEQIAHHLERQIVTGDLVEGERIQEMRIVAELEVSRGSVREALLILQRRHLIDIFPRRGAVVTELTPALVKSLYEVLNLQLSLVVRRWAEVWQQAGLEPFMEGIQTIQEAVVEEDTELFFERSLEWLKSASVFVANPYLDQQLKDMQPSVRRAYYLALQMNKRELEESFSFLRGLLDAVLLRQSERAAEYLEEFVMHQRNLVLESLFRVKQIEMAWARRHRR